MCELFFVSVDYFLLCLALFLLIFFGLSFPCHLLCLFFTFMDFFFFFFFFFFVSLIAVDILFFSICLVMSTF